MAEENLAKKKYSFNDALTEKVYLHSSKDTFLKAYNGLIGKATDRYKKAYLDILDKQIIKTKTIFEDFLSEIDSTEADFIDELKKIQINSQDFKEIYNQTIDNIISTITEDEKKIRQVLISIIDEQWKEIVKIQKAIDDNNGELKTKGGVFVSKDNVKKLKAVVITKLSEEFNLDKNELQAVFAGTSRFEPLLKTILKISKAKRKNAIKIKLSAEELKNIGMNADLQRYIRGNLGEAISGKNLQTYYENCLRERFPVGGVLNTGTKKIQNKTIKVDLLFTFLNGNLQEELGLTIKNLREITDKKTKEKFYNFTIETGTHLSDLISKMRTVRGNDDSEFEYAILNFANLTSHAYNQQDLGEIQNFILYNINAYAGIFFGLSLSDAINENDKYFNNAVFYDGIHGIVKPIYKILQSIKEKIQKSEINSKSMNNLYISFSKGQTNQELQQTKEEKLKTIQKGDSNSGVFNYPPNLVAVGVDKGKIMIDRISYHITMKAFTDFFNQ